MLREALEYLTTPCPPAVRRFGYLAEAVALGARHRRQRRAWAPHVAACRRFIMEAAARVPPDGRALIVGSGRLIEVPLAELAQRFGEVVLADLVHVRSVRRQVARFPNVRLVELDVTGALAPLDRLLSGRPQPGFVLPEPILPPPPGGRFAFAVSCNLLSQLPLMPLEAIERKAADLPEAERRAFAGRLSRDHLRWLSQIADHAALFSDLESQWLRDGTMVEREDSLWDLPLPAPDSQWLWEIAPAPEQDRYLDLRHQVGAWFDVRPLAEAATTVETSC